MTDDDDEQQPTASHSNRRTGHSAVSPIKFITVSATVITHRVRNSNGTQFYFHLERGSHRIVGPTSLVDVLIHTTGLSYTTQGGLPTLHRVTANNRPPLRCDGGLEISLTEL